VMIVAEKMKEALSHWA